jgi:hypothetical protein
MSKEVGVILRRSNRQMKLRWRCLLLLVLCCMPAYGQIKGQDVFAPVPTALRADLVERLKLLIEYQRTQQWEKQYDLLSIAFTQGNSKDEYVKRNRHWYTEVVPEDLIVNFAPEATTVHESSPDAGWWTIEGCAKFGEKGRIVELHASVDAYRERGNWYFSSVGVITPIDGTPQPCRYSSNAALSSRRSAEGRKKSDHRRRR